MCGLFDLATKLFKFNHQTLPDEKLDLVGSEKPALNAKTNNSNLNPIRQTFFYNVNQTTKRLTKYVIQKYGFNSVFGLLSFWKYGLIETFNKAIEKGNVAKKDDQNFYKLSIV